VTARTRLLVAMVVSAAVVAGGLVMERRIGAAPRARSAAPPGVSGARYCPHGGGQGWRAWIVLANPTDVPSEVILTSRTGTGPPQTAASTVAPRTHAYVEVPAPEMASSTVVEFFGSPVAAGMVTARPDGEGGVGAEPCADRPATRWFVPEASTLRGQDATVVIHNPFGSEAVIDVRLLGETGPISHGRLRGLVLDPGQVKAVSVGRFALGETGVAASVEAHLGRVVVGGVNLSTAGVRTVVGTPAAARSWVLPGAGEAAAGRLVVSAPADDAAFRADALGGAGPAPLVDLESVAGESSTTFDLPAEGGGVLVQGEGAAPLLAGRLLVPPAPEPAPEPARERRGGGGQGGGGQGGGGRPEEEPPEPSEPEPGDLAATGGAPAGATRWVALPATPPEGGPAALVLQNPGGGAAQVTVSVLGSGEARPEVVEVPAGSFALLELPSTPVAVLVESEGAPVVPAQVSLDPRTYAIAVGVPVG
jgi:hypothetical protein